LRIKIYYMNSKDIDFSSVAVAGGHRKSIDNNKIIIKKGFKCFMQCEQKREWLQRRERWTPFLFGRIHLSLNFNKRFKLVVKLKKIKLVPKFSITSN
jgi:hypothetical protein